MAWKYKSPQPEPSILKYDFLEKYGMYNNSYVMAVQSVTELSMIEVRKLYKDLFQKEVIDIPADNFLARTTLKYILHDLFKDLIQHPLILSNFTDALKKAKHVAKTSHIDIVSKNQNAKVPDGAPKTGQKIDKMQQIEDIIINNPECDKSGIVSKITLQLDLTDTTALQYYYKVKKRMKDASNASV